MSRYKEIPPEHVRFYLWLSSCGDEVCNCFHFTLYSEVPSKRTFKYTWEKEILELERKELYESSWLCGYDVNEYNKLMLELKEVLNHYQIKSNIDTETCFWDIEIVS